MIFGEGGKYWLLWITYMDVGGRAKQGARAEDLTIFSGTKNGRTCAPEG